MEEVTSSISMNSSCLRIAVADDRLYFTVSEGPPYKIGGILVEVYDIISSYLGVCREFVLPSDGLIGYRLPNGSWVGALGYVNRSKADMAGLSSNIPRSMEVVDLTEPLTMDEYNIMYKRPSFQPEISGFFKPFTPLIWIGLFFSVLAMIAVTTFILYWDPIVTHRIGGNGRRQRALRAGGKSALWNVSQMLCQSVPWEPQGIPGRVVGGVWLLSALILGTVYRSNLKAMLILPRIVLPFDNLKELSQSGITIFAPTGNHFYDNVLKAPPDSVFGSLQKQLNAHEDIPRALRDIISGRVAVGIPQDNIAVVMHNQFSLTGRCTMYQMSEGILKGMSMSLAIRRGAPFKAKVDRVIRGLKEFGIIDHLFRKATVNATDCLKPITVTVGSDALRSLSLGDFYGVFGIYVVGITVGFVAFLMEICVHLARKNQQRSGHRPHLIRHST